MSAPGSQGPEARPDGILSPAELLRLLRGRQAFAFHRATPLGEGGIALFELYGEGAERALRAFFRPRVGELPALRKVRLGDLVDAAGEAIDEAVLTRVPADSVGCGLDAWIVSVHGGIWIQRRVEEILVALGGTGLSMRDLLRLSLACGALDAPRAAAYELLAQARTEKAARFFLRQRRGEISERLCEALHLMEAGREDGAAGSVGELLLHSRQAFRLGHPLRVLLAGRPNAGKSTLFNRLIGEERAVVTPVPGTTLDLLEGWISLEDYPVILSDSAGLRPPVALDPVEREGIRRVRGSDFDAVVYLVPHPWQLTAEDELFLESVAAECRLLVASLADLAGSREAPAAGLRISALTGEGVEELRSEILRRWIDDREDPCGEIACAAFTRPLIAALTRCVASEAHAARQGGCGVDHRGTAVLDVFRRALVESLHASWPPAERPEESIVE